MATSAIEWTTKTWNPTVGCDKVSAGCTHCYAATLAHRLPAMGQATYEGLTKKLPDGSVNWTGVVRELPERLTIPLGWKKPARIFVDSMSDLFHEDVSYEFVESVFRIMALCPQHTFQILTKRPHRMREFTLNRHVGTYKDHPLTNVWLGVSVEDQRAADERIPLLLQTPASVRFLSCEPLLGPIDLRHGRWIPPIGGGPCVNLFRPWEEQGPTVDWVISGGESGPKHRFMNLQWARSLRDQCEAAGVAFFHKQNGGRTPKANGRELDGRIHDAFPVTL